MEALLIKGKRRLEGEIDVQGAKNSVLPILAASILINGESVIHNCPDLSDVRYTVDILKYLGARVEINKSTITVNAASVTRCSIPKFLMEEMRSSIIFLGSLASRTGNACLYCPGGCDIGLRPIDLHISSLRMLGYTVSFDGSDICCTNNGAGSNRIELDFPSVGATENIILASVLLSGKTQIINAAKEPEITDLADFLNKAGAKITGASTPIIEIEGVDSLHSVEHTVIADRVVASTLMCASSITSGDITLKGIKPSYLLSVFPVFEKMGNEIYLFKDTLNIKSPARLHRVRKIETLPYPGFPTDCQAIVMACLARASGTSVMTETIFENRFRHVPQLNRFGADIAVSDKTAIIRGVSSFHPAQAVCTDLRGGAAVVLAALSAQGVSAITDIKHIDRGYQSIENQLCALGADVKRINYEEKYEKKQALNG